MLEQFFQACTSLVYDAMPSLWQKMSVEDRHHIISKINCLHLEVKALDESPWGNKNNVLELNEFAPLDQIIWLRACCLTAKRGSAVISQTVEECNDTTVEKDNNKTLPFYEAYKLHPSHLLSEYKKYPTNKEAYGPLLLHMANRACHKHWMRGKRKQETNEPSAYLDVTMTADQQRLITLLVEAMLLALVKEDAYGRIRCVRQWC